LLWAAGSGRFLGSIFEAPAFVSGLDDIAMMSEPIEHGGRHLGVTEHLRPIGEGEVCRDGL